MPLPAGSDFSFDSRNSSPYDSAPESPRGFNSYFFSAPSSPNYQESFSFTPDQHLNCDYHHGSDKKCDDNKAFAFIPGDGLNLIPVSSADELFYGGKIKPCEPKFKKIFQSRLSIGQNSKICSEHFTFREENVKDASSSSSSSFGWLHKKWKLKDLLFRSGSEGHETNKYDVLRKSINDDVKNSSSITNLVLSRNKTNKERATLSAHERHYKVNRAAAEEMKKRTYLPYKQNLVIGCMNLDAASVSHPSRTTLKIR